MAETSYKIQEFVAHATEVTCLTFGNNCKIFATGGKDCKVNIWSIGNTTNLWTLSSNKSPIQSLCFDNDEQYVVSGTMNGSIKVFDLNEGRLARQLSGHQVNVTCLQYHAFGEFIVSGSSDCTMKVWDVKSKTCLQTYTGHEKEITCVKFSPDGRWVASSSKDGSLHIWDIVAGKNLHTFKSNSSHVTSFEFNPVELVLSTVTSTRTVKLWDLETMKPISSSPPDSSPVRAVCYVNNDKSFCSATKDSLKVWNWDPSVRLVGTTDVPWEKVTEIKCSPDNNIIGGSFMSNFVSIWSVNIDDVPPPSTPRTSSNDNGKQISSRNSFKLSSGSESKSTDVRPRSNSIDNRRESLRQPSPGAQSPQRGLWGSNNPNTVYASSPTRISSSSPINKKSQDLFAKVLAQSKLSPDMKASSRQLSPDARIPAMQLPPSGPKPTRDYDSLDLNINADFKPDYKEEYRPTARIEDKSNRSDFRPRCLDINEGDEELSLDPSILHDDARISPQSLPKMKWESGNSAINLESSMGESFWRKFQQSQHANGVNSNRKADILYSLDDDSNDFKMERAAINGVASQPSHKPMVGQSESQNGLSRKPLLSPGGQPHESDHTTSSSTAAKSRSDALTRIDEIVLSSPNFTSTLSQRLTSLRILRRLWERGDMDAVIDHLSTLLDTVNNFDSSDITSYRASIEPVIQQSLEFFSNIDFHRSNSILVASLSFNQAISLMNILNSTFFVLSDDSFQRQSKLVIVYQAQVILIKVIQICELFSDAIRQSKALVSGPSPGVDLVREERIRKYKSFESILSKIKGKVDTLQNLLQTDSRMISHQFNDLTTRFKALVR